jgi:hypothetical protein
MKMAVSAYTIVLGVEQRRYPWRAAIESALSLADEFCVVYDRRFDDPEMLQKVDSRVKPIEREIDFLEWDFINKALTVARRNCKGEWCLRTEMDYVLGDSCAAACKEAIAEADSIGAEAVGVPVILPMPSLVRKGDIPLSQLLTRNIEAISHQTSGYMIAVLDSDVWDGKYIKSYDYDDWAYYDSRTMAWFNDPNGIRVEPDDGRYGRDCVWHYSFYNLGRKNAQGRQNAPWQDRIYGRSCVLDVDRQIELLKETIVIDPAETREGYGYYKSNGWLPKTLKHPTWAAEWVAEMGLDAE